MQAIAIRNKTCHLAVRRIGDPEWVIFTRDPVPFEKAEHWKKTIEDRYEDTEVKIVEESR